MNTTALKPWRRERGVTLIELMVVIVILGILSSLAVSSYRRYVLRANRVEATSALLRLQVAQEKHFLQANSYANDNVTMSNDPTVGGLGIPTTTTPGGRYTISVAANGVAGTTYLATATATGSQTQDTALPGLHHQRSGAAPTARHHGLLAVLQVGGLPVPVMRCGPGACADQ